MVWLNCKFDKISMSKSNPVLYEDERNKKEALREASHPEFEGQYRKELKDNIERILKEIYPDLRS